MPKSQMSRHNQNQTACMEKLNLHKQRLITIAIAGLGLIFLFLPWVKEGTTSHMGYGIWGGIASALAFAVAIVDSILLGDKTKSFDKQGKLIATIAFAFALLLTIIVLIASSGTGQQATQFGFAIEVKKSAGIGVWLALILEIAGLVYLTGVLDKLMQQNASTPGSTPKPPTSSAPPPPPKPKA
jgi:drug/metabolite transporter (DMT)-like permease